MNFGPSTIDRFLAELPEDLQILALEALNMLIETASLPLSLWNQRIFLG